jgi:hypothetical protein
MPIIIATRLDFNPKIKGFDKNARPDPNSDIETEGVTATTTIFWQPEERRLKYYLEYRLWEWDNDIGRDDDQLPYAQFMELNGPHDEIEPTVMEFPKTDAWNDEGGGDEIYARVTLFPQDDQWLYRDPGGGDPIRRVTPPSTFAYTNRVDRRW